MKKIIGLIAILIGLCSTLTVYGQERNLTVTGTVIDEEWGDPLPGVNVFIETATNIGIVTDVNGNFRMQVASGEVLVFQMVGMEPHRLPVTASMADVVITLSAEAGLLDEVIVTGIGTQRRIAITSAITTVDVDQLSTPATSLNNMLAGRVAGVMTSLTSGEPGQNISTFWVRGIGTFGANAGALVLIDGLEGRLEDIDPDDVQSFQILKDASATAVFGVRGANGVVIVTTRRGHDGPLQVSARATLQINQLRRLPQFLGSYEYARLANEARAMMGESNIFTDQQLNIIRHGLDPDLYPNVNWLNEIIRNTSLQRRYFVSVRGGSQFAKYFVSMGMQIEEAAYRQDNARFGRQLTHNRIHYRANIDMVLTPTTNLFFGTEGQIRTLTQPGGMSTTDVWNAVRLLTPLTMPVRYSDGTLPTAGLTAAGGAGLINVVSPYAILNYMGYTDHINNQTRLTLRLDQRIEHGALRGLNFSVQGMTDLETFMNEERIMMPAFYRATGRDEHGGLIKAMMFPEMAMHYFRWQNFYRRYYGQTTIEWNRDFGVHNVGALLFAYMEERQDSRRALDVIGLNNVPFRRQNVSGRINYGFNNTYFIDANFGYTGSSQFQRGRRFGFFPSIAVGWVPTSYDWMHENLPFISFMKIRASHGLAGNDNISGDQRFPYLTLVTNRAATAWPFLPGPLVGVTETRIGADNLIWEVARKSNVGFEINFMQDRLRFITNVFYDRRENIFQQRLTLPAYLGLITLPYSNVGSMYSMGSDGNVQFTQRINRDMEFTVRANYTFSVNLIDRFEEAELPYSYLSIVGKPYNVFRGFIAEGLFTCYDDIATRADQSAFGRIRPGDIRFRDVSGDGVITDNDRVPLALGNQLPRLVYGVGADFRWRNLTAAFLFRGHAGVSYFRSGVWLNNDIGFNSPGWIPFHSGELGNVLAIAANPANRWTPAWYSGDPATENPNAIFPRLSYGGNTNNEQISTFWMGNSAFLRLQEISLRYRIRGREWLNTVGLSSMDLEFVTNNVFVWDRVGLFDPEQAHFNGAAYPIPRSFTFQLYLNF